MDDHFTADRKMSTMQDTKISAKGVQVYYAENHAIKDVDVEIGDKTVTAFIGPSGCGKSTLLRMIAGLEKITGGTLEIDDMVVNDIPPSERGIAMVFQSYALFPHMSVLENVMYGLTFSGFGKEEARNRALTGLDLVGLKGFDGRLPSELSGGQQQRVAVARALVLEPQVLLFDEPLSNLDAKLRRQVREDIRAIQQDLGLTVVYVTHDQEEALAVSDEIVVMRNAAIAQIGTPRTLYDAPNDRFVADFIGEANLISCEIVSVTDDVATIEIENYQHTLPARGLPPGPATLAVRPSRIHTRGDTGVEATVDKATYVGVRMEYTLTGAFGQVFAVEDDVDTPFDVGTVLRMSFAEKGPVLLPHEQ